MAISVSGPALVEAAEVVAEEDMMEEAGEAVSCSVLRKYPAQAVVLLEAWLDLYPSPGSSLPCDSQRTWLEP